MGPKYVLWPYRTCSNYLNSQKWLSKAKNIYHNNRLVLNRKQLDYAHVVFEYIRAVLPRVTEMKKEQFLMTWYPQIAEMKEYPAVSTAMSAGSLLTNYLRSVK